MAISKIKYFCNILKLEAFSRSSVCQKAQLRNFICSRYCSSNSNITPESEEIKVKSNLQAIRKKDRKLSVIDEKDRELVETLKAGTNPYYPHENQYEKIKTYFTEGFKELGKRAIRFSTGINLNIQQEPFYLPEVDIIIIGCNPIGLSIAFALKERFPDTPSVLVIDKDDNFPKASTNIGQSMLTQQLFVDEEEIEMSKYAAEFLQSFPRLTGVESRPRFKLPYEPLGSLLLADETNMDKLLQNVEILKSHNIVTKILDRKALQSKFPWLKLEDVLFGNLCMSNEGIYDPWSFLIGLKCKAINSGVEFMQAEVLDFGLEDDYILKRVICKLPNGKYYPIGFSVCVLACGIESLNFVEIINSTNLGPIKIKLPLEERMKYEYCFYSPKGPGLDTPIVIDSDGTYFRREGLCNHYVAGVPCVKHSKDENLEPYKVFNNKVKPFLLKRVPQFDQIDLVKGWIDSYDFCVSNEVGILGPHPNDPRLIFALGFSHFGLQHAPAIGRAVMEYIAYDNYDAIDMTRYHIENLWQKKRLRQKRKQEELIESNQRIAISD